MKILDKVMIFLIVWVNNDRKLLIVADHLPEFSGGLKS